MIPRLFVLVVDPDPVHRRSLSLILRQHDYQVTDAGTGLDALERVRLRIPDALLLNPDLDDLPGTELLLRLQPHTFPVLIVSSDDDERKVVEALDAGVSDYIIRPYRENELMARLRGAMRRAGISLGRRQLVAGDLRVDVSDRRVFIANKEVHLTTREYQLLQVLASEAGRVVTHEQLLSQVWSPSHAEDIQYLRVFVRQLRSKVELNPKEPRRILTALGVGYRLVPILAE
ncbi:MAG TPA: response regulator transcription factor [Polyangiaceae bacterium]|jgi:two-component system KDP operon response regulator KdpE|nr:response regulator transcription factor [Polyangiaceae bacterium]